MSSGRKLREFLARPRALVVPGVPNALTARIAEETGFPAVFFTGAGFANLEFGFPDLGLTTMTKVVQQVGRIVEAVEIPVLADADTGYGNARNVRRTVRELERDWDRMMTFYRFPREHWKHLRITNVIESPFATVRLRADAAKRYKRVTNATALIWKVLMVAQSRFRRLDAPELLAEVYHGVTYVDGLRASTERKGRVAAWSHLHTS